MERVRIVMPAYNESENIKEVVTNWHDVACRLQSEGVECRLVIADDGSLDDTYDKLCERKEHCSLLQPLTKPNGGHGATLMMLYQRAISESADWIFQTDSDGQTDPADFWDLWRCRKGYDLIVGERVSREDGVARKMVTRVLKLVVRLTMGVSVPDANTPFRLMRVEHVKPIIEKVPSDFFLANVAISALCVKAGLRCKWMPIKFRPRQGGVNSINMKRIIKIGLKSLRELKEIGRK